MPVVSFYNYKRPISCTSRGWELYKRIAIALCDVKHKLDGAV
jgi:hypothetical protein